MRPVGTHAETPGLAERLLIPNPLADGEIVGRLLQSKSGVALTKRVCIQSGCGRLIDQGESRCTAHERARDKSRGTRQARGYDTPHDQLRASWQRRLDAGRRVVCWRCGCAIDPASWQLGHCDDDRSKYHGPECVPCNTATNDGRVTCPHESHDPPPF